MSNSDNTHLILMLFHEHKIRRTITKAYSAIRLGDRTAMTGFCFSGTKIPTHEINVIKREKKQRRKHFVLQDPEN